MFDYKIGDRIVMVANSAQYGIGTTGIINNITTQEGVSYYEIHFGDDSYKWCVPRLFTLDIAEAVADPVNKPAHYTAYRDIEVIQLTEQLNFCKGNAVKYIARAGLKDPLTELQDLQKAEWYIRREIDRVKREQNMLLLADGKSESLL